MAVLVEGTISTYVNVGCCGRRLEEACSGYTETTHPICLKYRSSDVRGCKDRKHRNQNTMAWEHQIE